MADVIGRSTQHHFADCEAASNSSNVISLSNYRSSAGNISQLTYPCPGINSSTYTTHQTSAQTFRYICGINYHSGDYGDNGYPIDNLGAMVAYSVEDCVEACSLFNEYNASGEQSCMAVTFGAQLDYFYKTYHANCFLKNATGSTSDNKARLYISARLM